MKKIKEIFLTPKGVIKLKEQIKKLVGIKRKKIKGQIEEMRNRGDLSENDGYTLALQDYESNEAQIAELTMMLEKGIVEEKDNDGEIGLGDTVELSSDSGDVIYEIVGANEADPLKRKITPESPIGRALMNQKVGSKIKVTLPKGDLEYTVKKIS